MSNLQGLKDKKVYNTLYEEPITSQILRLSFQSQGVRKEAKKLKRFQQDIEDAYEYKKAKIAKFAQSVKSSKSKKNKT